MGSDVISATERGILDDYWMDMQHALATNLDYSIDALRHYHVHLDGRVSVAVDHVLVSGVLLSSWRPAEQHNVDFTQTKVVIRLSLADWFAVGKHSTTLRILNCPLVGDNRPPILDTTVGTTVVAAGVFLRQDECIQIAELFSGGFMGWGQTVSVMEHHAVPVRLRWALDSNPICGRSFVAQHDHALVVTATTCREEALQHEGPVFLNACINETWWQTWPARKPAQLWCCSPPCQPWSTAGAQQGLHDKDGQLLMRLLSLMQAFQPEVVCIEEVAGFRKHKHFAVLEAIWKDIGYAEAWSQQVDLIDFAPQVRNRSLFVLVRLDLAANLPVLVGKPVMPMRPTLGSFDCLLDLCPALAKACNLPPDVLAKYLDPYYCPPLRFPNKRPDPYTQRVVTSQGRVGTIMAQYHRQHLLPEAALARGGIMGNLFKDDSGLRFLAGAEVALMHCNHAPFFMPADDSDLMTIVGNSLSLPQAALPLAFAVSCLQKPGSRVDPHQVVYWTLQDRAKASSVAIIPLSDGWVLCKPEQVQAAMTRLRPRVPWGQMPCAGLAAMELVWIKDATEAVPVLKSTGFTLPHLLDSIGVQYDEHALQDLRPLRIYNPLSASLVETTQPSATLDVPVLPELRVAGLAIKHDARTGPRIMIVLGVRAVYAIAKEGPSIIEALHQVAHLDGLTGDDDKQRWQHISACPVLDFEDFGDTVTLLHDSCLIPISQPDCPSTGLQGVCFLAYVDPARLFLPEDVALQVGAGFPVQHWTNMGWFPRLTPAQVGHVKGVSIIFQELPGRFRLRQEDIAKLCHGIFFIGCLNAREQATYFSASKVRVKVQVEGKTLWRGFLPGHISFEDVLQDWKRARTSVGFLASARVGSGPFWPEPTTTLQQAVNDHTVPAFTSRDGSLLVTVFPETRGGGAKDDKYATCQTQLAKEFLEHGVNLADSSTLVDRLLPQAGLARVQRVLALTHTDNRWQQLLQLCQQFSVTVPPASARLQQAQTKIKAKARARAQENRQQVAAASFRLQDDYFFNADGSPAPILSQLSPGCSGVVLLDPEEAAHHMAMRAMDELGVLVLGHTCPHPPSCTGTITVPAVNALSEPVLLKTCLHQLGERKLVTRCKHSADVSTEEAYCCAFTVFQDDWTESEWAALTANPVRKVLDVWRQVGIEAPFSSPWGRSFRAASDTSSGRACATLQFHARVCHSQRDAVLQKSGFNRVFVTPKTWTSELLSGYSIVWLQGARDEIAASAMTLSEQCGLVRSKNRLGVRVPDKAFTQAFQQLRPGTQPPARLIIKETYRLSGLPPGLRLEDITAWGNAVAWPLRPLRPLGPRQWIVGAASAPPEGLLSFNEHPILVQKAAPKTPSQPVVCAGRVAPASASSGPVGEDPWIHNDPWKQFLQKAKPSDATAVGATRQLAAPTEERFREQDRRFQQIEATLKEVQQNQSSLATETKQLRQDVQVEVTSVRKDFGTFSVELEKQMKTNMDAMHQALMLQQSQMSAGFADLRNLLESQQTAPRRPKRDAGHPQEESGGMNDL